MNSPLFLIVDLFCGAGGTTTGFAQAEIEGNKIAKVIACVNHDAKAIESHWKNHPDVVHFEEDIRTLDLTALTALVSLQKELFPDAYLVLWASLECTNFSKAKGGLPRDADSRTLADHLYRYIHALQPDYIQIENVVEFMSWGPLTGKVLKTKEGYSFCKVDFVEVWDYDYDENGDYKTEKIYAANGKYLGDEYIQIKNGEIKVLRYLIPESKKNGSDWMRWRKTICNQYNFYDEWKELNSANFGAYTSRNRLFGCFAKPWLPVVFPQATHAKNPSVKSMHGDLRKWKAVKEVLNFKDEGESIFNRKKPLSEKTLERIYAGLIKYVAKGDTAFISKYFSGRPANKNISTEGPAGTIKTIDGQALVSVEPISILKYDSTDKTGKHYPPSVDAPCPVIIAQSRLGIVQGEFLLKYNSTNGETGKHVPPSVDEPAPVVSTQGRLGLVQPEFIVQRNNGEPESKLVDVNGPARTLTSTGGNQDLIQPKFLLNYNHSSDVNDLNEAAPTLLTSDKLALCSPEFLAAYYGNGDNVSSVENPAPTIPTKDRCALVQPEYFIDKHFSKSQNQSIDEPAGTVMPTDKHRLVEAERFLMPTNYYNGPRSLDEPCPVLTASKKYHYIINPAWGGNAGSIDEPCCVVVARQDKAPLYFVQVEHGPVKIAVYENDSGCTIKIKQFMAAFGLVDIKMRMLRVLELLKIQGFPEGYHLAGNQADQKKFIGNSVVPQVVKAWCKAMAVKILETKKEKVV